VGYSVLGKIIKRGKYCVVGSRARSASCNGKDDGDLLLSVLVFHFF